MSTSVACARNEIDLGTTRVHQVLCSLGHPELKFKNVIHVAGTNGKGSTCNYIVAGLTQVFDTVTFFSSPPLFDPTDTWRKCHADTWTHPSHETYEGHQASVLADHPTTPPLTTFEASFVGFLVWSVASGAAAVVVEVGMGGTHDATNVFYAYPCACHRPIPVPRCVAVITRLALDHVPVLGTSVLEIMHQKLGIVHPSFTHSAVVGVQGSPATADAVQSQWTDQGVAHLACVEVGEDTLRLCQWTPDPPRRTDVVLPLAFLRRVHGYLRANLALAWAVVQSVVGAPSVVAQAPMPLAHPRVDPVAMARARWPGRLDWVTSPYATLLLVDGAHNSDGAHALAGYLHATVAAAAYQRVCWVVGEVQHKPGTLEQVLGILVRALPGLVHDVAVAEFSTPREMGWIKPTPAPQLVQQILAQSAWKVGQVIHVARVWEIPRAWFVSADTLVVVTGSLYLVADVLLWNQQHALVGENNNMGGGRV